MCAHQMYQAHSLVVSSLPGNPLLVWDWEGVGLHTHILYAVYTLHAQHTRLTVDAVNIQKRLFCVRSKRIVAGPTLTTTTGPALVLELSALLH